MRILIVSTTYPPADISGVGTLVYELGAELERQGHQASVWTRRARSTDSRARAFAGSRLTFPLRVAWRFLRERAWRGLDVLHVHESDGVLVAMVARLARARRNARPRIAATLQVSYVQERRAVRAVHAAPGGAPVSRPTPGEQLFRWVRAPVLAALGAWTARLADVVVAPSRATAAELRDDYGAREVVVIPNGIAADPLSLRERAGVRGGHASDPRPLILFVGRLRTRKAAAVLLEAMALLRRRAVAARAVLVGDGEQSAALRAQAARLDLEGDQTVVFAGRADRDRIAIWFEQSSVFCLPSTYEGFPLAILEAMAAALPVVATRVSGNPEAVADGVSGRLVDPENAEALAGAIADLLADPAAARRMGQAGRRRLGTDFAIASVASAYLQLWERQSHTIAAP